MNVKHQLIELEVEELQDPRLSLEVWKRVIDELIKKHGKRAVLYTDAGYNNVSFRLTKKLPK